MDSNHDKQIQNLLCYHYTTGQGVGTLSRPSRRGNPLRGFPLRAPPSCKNHRGLLRGSFPLPRKTAPSPEEVYIVSAVKIRQAGCFFLNTSPAERAWASESQRAKTVEPLPDTVGFSSPADSSSDFTRRIAG